MWRRISNVPPNDRPHEKKLFNRKEKRDFKGSGTEKIKEICLTERCVVKVTKDGITGPDGTDMPGGVIDVVSLPYVVGKYDLVSERKVVIVSITVLIKIKSYNCDKQTAEL